MPYDRLCLYGDSVWFTLSVRQPWRKRRGPAWVWHILPSSAKLDLTRCKEREIARKRERSRGVSADTKQPMAKITQSQLQAAQKKQNKTLWGAFLSTVWRLVTSNPNNRLAMWREVPGAQSIKFLSYHTFLILSSKPLRALQNVFILIFPLYLFQEIVESRVLKRSWNYCAWRNKW